jgi:HAMP domain-containing protein
MNNDSSAIWQEIMANWHESQKTISEQMLSNFQHYSDAMSAKDTLALNPILVTYQAVSESFFKNLGPMSQKGTITDWEDYLKDIPGSEPLVTTMKTLLLSGQQVFENLSSNFAALSEQDESHAYLLKALSDMSNPNSWLKYTGDEFDISAQKLSEGPLFSGISDIENRLAQVTDSWFELFNQSKDYHAIVFSRWSQAFSRFLDELKELDNEQQAELTPRKLIDMWSATANEELLLLHRSEEFLAAQRAVIRASMQYRLHEKHVAEVICEALHIPTRDEIDDLHKSVTELRRELRKTKAELEALTKKPSQKQPSQHPGTTLP